MNDTTRTSAPALGSATFKLQDEPGGRISVKITFDPAVDPDSPGTPAQQEVVELLQFLAGRMAGAANG